MKFKFTMSVISFNVYIRFPGKGTSNRGIDVIIYKHPTIIHNLLSDNPKIMARIMLIATAPISAPFAMSDIFTRIFEEPINIHIINLLGSICGGISFQIE